MIRTRRTIAGIVALASLTGLLPARSQGALVPQGGEFPVSAGAAHGEPAICPRPGGGFIVLWAEGRLIAGRRLDATGVLADDAFLVSVDRSSPKLAPRVACGASDDAFGVWESLAQDGDGIGIFGRRFDVAGETAGDEAQINTTTTEAQIAPRICATGDGAFLVVWEDLSVPTTSGGIVGRRFDSTGRAVGDEFQLSAGVETTFQSAPAVCCHEDGAVVVWEGAEVEAVGATIVGRRYDGTGLPLGDEFQIQPPTTGAQRRPDLCCRPDGGFVVVWEAVAPDGTSSGIAARQFDAPGDPEPMEIVVDEGAADRGAPALACAPDGRFVVAWANANPVPAGGGLDVVARPFAADGSPAGPEIPVSETMPTEQMAVAVATDGQGRYMVVWENVIGEFGDYAVFGRALADGCDGDLACADDDRCTADRCLPSAPDADENGCVHEQAVFCSPSDQCHAAGECAPATGECTHRPAPDGTACDDGDRCTRVDECQGGTCVGTEPVVCAARDACDGAGECVPATGECTHRPAPDGTACDDGDRCTRVDECQGGACVGTEPVVCVASDPCHAAGACDPATGACTNPLAADGKTCDDRNRCTRSDTCQAGVCVGGDSVTCQPVGQCFDAGVCNPTTGVCTAPPKSNGAPCTNLPCIEGGVCQGGVCVGSAEVECPAPDTCHEAGTCNPFTGRCINPPKLDGARCDDGDLCTRTDTCRARQCVGGDPVTCAALDVCHVAGVCDSATGSCSNPPAVDGTSCNDGDTCTLIDGCFAGVCGGVLADIPEARCETGRLGAIDLCAAGELPRSLARLLTKKTKRADAALAKAETARSRNQPAKVAVQLRRAEASLAAVDRKVEKLLADGGLAPTCAGRITAALTRVAAFVAGA